MKTLTISVRDPQGLKFKNSMTLITQVEDESEEALIELVKEAAEACVRGLIKNVE